MSKYQTSKVHFFGAVILLLGWLPWLGIAPAAMAQDGSGSDSSGYKPSYRNTYNPQDRYGDPITNPGSGSSFFLNNPSNVNTEVTLDSSGQNYIVTEKVGEDDFRPPMTMTYEEFTEYRRQQLAQGYWRESSEGLDGESALTGRRLIPKIYFSPVFDRVFGGNFVDIKPNGSILLNFGGRFQRTENPSIPIRQQRNGGFNFDQQISLNLIGKIGEKLKITANWDTKATFAFENNLKVEYTSFEEDIIQQIEAGNVSLPINNTLIQGQQNLFGFKTQLQFGRLRVTALASNSRGQADQIALKGGAQTREFEIAASDYDYNRHFFLSQYFRDIYEQALSNLPAVNSGVTITRVEAYITNRVTNTQDIRNIAAFLDLGEADPFLKRSPVTPVTGITEASNIANSLYQNLLSVGPILRDPDQITGILTGAGGQFQLRNGTDYTSLNGSRKLKPQEYSFNNELGYMSLNVPLRNDEVLAVSFEYTKDGRTYKVGELNEDYSSFDDDRVIFLKMLRPVTIRTDLPTWDLMMKNVYSLNASQVNRDNFKLRVIYKDDLTGIDNPALHEGVNLKDRQLVRVFNLDNLNMNNDPNPDGNFDYIENVTIDSRQGRIFFPILEPFGDYLEARFLPSEAQLIDKYVYDALYDSTQADARLATNKDKFYLRGEFQSTSSNEIALPGINIAPGSVRVTAGTMVLTEGSDYTVDYNIGRVKIINEGILASGREIKIDYEKSDIFNFQTKTLVGLRADYKFNENFNLGSTILYLNQRPLISRVSIGNEPISNAIYGLDMSYQKDSRFLTKAVDALPLIETKQPSSVAMRAEFAQLLPGSAKQLGEGGVSYIDDFEGAETPYDLTRVPQRWKLGSTPLGIPGATANNLSYTYRRAKLSWYSIDQIFFRTSGSNLPNVPDADLNNNLTRAIGPQEVFPNRDLQQISTLEFSFDLAYYPEERGMYNFNPDLTPTGQLAGDPARNFGAITRPITFDTDFDNANIEYIEFWLMDPFSSPVDDGRGNPQVTSGGKLFFNLGNVSEDLMKDNRHAFENGLPVSNDPDAINNLAVTDWGRVTKQQFITNSFSNVASARQNQDVGLDGLNSQEEVTFFQTPFISQIPSVSAQQIVAQDVSNDDFKYFLGQDYDDNTTGILQRYKNFNGMENNSPDLTSTGNNFSPRSSTLPDNEDLNQDNTISDLESYFEYEVDIRDGLNNQYVVDQVVNNNTTYYQFRIPIRQPTRQLGSISDFKSIRFLRMYMTGWQRPAVLRLIQFQFVASQWRRYYGDLFEKGPAITPEPEGPRSFVVSSVNIEENGQTSGGETPYVLPPGVSRDQDNLSQNNRRLNEQSLSLCVEELRDKDAVAVFKRTNLDFIIYQRIKMYIHAEGMEGTDDNETSAFLRIGTDFTDNYYEIEVPLTLTPRGNTDPNDIWRVENEIDIDLSELYKTKVERDKVGADLTLRYSRSGLGANSRTTVSVVGRPDMSDVKNAMIGIRNLNQGSLDDQLDKSVCLWVNELRVTDFNKQAGVAATASLQTQLADLATVTASGRYTGVGYGSLQSRIGDRTRETTTQYDVGSNVQLDKFIPEKAGIRLPMYVSYGEEKVVPKFDPLDPDVPLDESLEKFDDKDEKKEYEKLVIDHTTRKSINFTNVQKVKTNPNAKAHIYDFENFAFNYAYSEEERTNINIVKYERKQYKGGIAWGYASQALYIEPFKTSEKLGSPYLQLVKDINLSPIPNSYGVRGDLIRDITMTQLRNEVGNNLEPQFEKQFLFNRNYNLKWNLTKSINLDYGAFTNAIIDEPDGYIDNDLKKDSVVDNILALGRMKNFNQTLGANYKLPLDKIPFLNWVSADARYTAGYTWTAGSLRTQDTLGNIIQNSQQKSINGRVNLTTLYNKVKFLKEINSPAPPPRKPPPTSAKAAEADTVREYKAVKAVLRGLMSMRSINLNYSLQQGTLLPGYLPNSDYFGFDNQLFSPGLPFVLGSQDPNIRYEASEKHWLSDKTALNTPFTQTRTETIGARTAVEPVRDFKIQLDVSRSATSSYSELYRYDPDPAVRAYTSQSPVRGGNYSLSFISIKTAFQKDDKVTNASEAFNQLEANRIIILNRLNTENPNSGNGEYAINGQDVLIPSFIAAYSGQGASDVNLSPFPKIPLPNWGIDYAGLSRQEFIKKIGLTSVSLSHKYTSVYNVNNFTSSLQYGAEFIEISQNTTAYPFPSLTNPLGEFIPVYVISGVTIQERFAPLVGVNVRTKSNITVGVKYNRDRSLNLNMPNAQVTEVAGQDVSLDVGFIKSGLKLPFRWQGRVITLKNEVTARLGISVRDSKTVQRKLDDIQTITAGNLIFQLRPNISYAVNQRLNVQLYFERNINSPKVTSSFRNTNTSFGLQIRFSLSQ